MEVSHKAEMDEMLLNQQKVLQSKEKEMLQQVTNANKENRRLKDLLKTKNEEMERMKLHLEEIEDDIRKLK